VCHPLTITVRRRAQVRRLLVVVRCLEVDVDVLKGLLGETQNGEPMGGRGNVFNAYGHVYISQTSLFRLAVYNAYVTVLCRVPLGFAAQRPSQTLSSLKKHYGVFILDLSIAQEDAGLIQHKFMLAGLAPGF